MGFLIGFSILVNLYVIIYPVFVPKSIKFCKFKKLGLSISAGLCYYVG